MLSNPFAAYSIVWSIIFIIFSTNLSVFTEYCNTEFRLFLIISIIVYFCIGLVATFWAKAKYKYEKKETFSNQVKRYGHIVIISLYLIYFLYQRRLPLLNGAYSSSNSGNEKGADLPFFYVPLVVGSLVYGYYLAYAFITTKENIYLVQFAVVLLLFMLDAHRGYAIFCVVIFAYLYLKKQKIRNLASIRVKWIVIACLFLTCILFIFEVLGNVRSGYSWNDNSYIVHLGQFHNSEIGAGPFSWIYTYATTPLATMYNIANTSIPNSNFIYILYCFIPESIVSLLDDSFPIEPNLIVSYQNAATAYHQPYLAYGITGCYIYLSLSIILTLFYFIAIRKIGHYVKLMDSILVLNSIMTVFQLPYYYNVTSLVPLFLLILGIFKRINND